MQKVRIAPTTLHSDLNISANLLNFIESALNQNVDEIHFDVIDGIYATNKAMNIKQAKLARNKFKDANFSVHIMAVNPKKFIKQYLKIAPRVLFFQYEGAKNLKQVEKLLSLAAPLTKIGLAIDLNTELTKELINLINKTSAVLIMTVQTGKSGQELNPSALNKVIQIKQNCNNITEIYVAGGINESNYKEVIAAGATTLSMGAGIYNLIKNNTASEFIKKVNK